MGWLVCVCGGGGGPRLLTGSDRIFELCCCLQSASVTPCPFCLPSSSSQILRARAAASPRSAAAPSCAWRWREWLLLPRAALRRAAARQRPLGLTTAQPQQGRCRLLCRQRKRRRWLRRSSSSSSPGGSSSTGRGRRRGSRSSGRQAGLRLRRTPGQTVLSSCRTSRPAAAARQRRRQPARCMPGGSRQPAEGPVMQAAPWSRRGSPARGAAPAAARLAAAPARPRSSSRGSSMRSRRRRRTRLCCPQGGGQWWAPSFCFRAWPR